MLYIKDLYDPSEEEKDKLSDKMSNGRRWNGRPLLWSISGWTWVYIHMLKLKLMHTKLGMN